MEQGTIQATDRLAAQIESLQEAFRKLAKAGTLKDLGGQFLGIIRERVPGGEISLLYRKDEASPWDYLVEQGRKGADQRASLPAGPLPSVCVVEEIAGQLRVIQRLIDRSSIGMVVDRPSAVQSGGELDSVALRLAFHLFDAAYQEMLYRRNEKELIFSLNHRVLQLNSLIDTGIEVSKLDQDASPHSLALERAASLTNASKGTVRVTLDGAIREEILFPPGISLPSSDEASKRIASSFVFQAQTFSFELFEKESRRGVLPFDETDQLLLDALARQVHASLENRYLHLQALEKMKIEQDIAVAASIQQKILPETLPSIPGYDIAGINIPSKSVGGDYYDCIPLPGGKYALVIADVAGKGVPAALLVSSLHAYLSAFLETTDSLVRLVQKLNTVISRASTPEKFITAFFAILTPETGEVETLNAGHNPAYVLTRDNVIRELNAGGLALAMFDIDLPFETERFVLAPGERLLLYTDGIPEAANEKQKLYDTDTPLQQFLLRNGSVSAGAFIQSLMADIRRFTGGAQQSDDITALYLVRG